MPLSPAATDANGGGGAIGDPAKDDVEKYPRLDGWCNNLLVDASFGSRLQPFNGVLHSTHEREYVCNPTRGPPVANCTIVPAYNCPIDRNAGRGWQCGYRHYHEPPDTGGLGWTSNVMLPLESDVVRFIAQSRPVKMFGGDNGDGTGPSTPENDRGVNQLAVGFLNMFMGHEGQATAGSKPSIDASVGPRAPDYYGNARTYMFELDDQETLDEQTVNEACTAYTYRNGSLGCTHEGLFHDFSFGFPFNVEKGERKRYAADDPFLPNEYFVPWQSMIEHKLVEQELGDGKRAPINVVSAWMHLHNVYSSNSTRFNMLKDDDWEHNGRMASRTITTNDGGGFLEQSMGATSYCSLSETVYIVPGLTLQGADAYDSAGQCWDQGRSENANFADPFCYRDSSTAAAATPSWRIIDLATTGPAVGAAPPCLGLAAPPPIGSCPFYAPFVTLNVGGTCSQELHRTGGCLPGDVHRAQCDAVAQRHDLDVEDYVISYTAGILPENVTIENWFPTAADVGIEFNGDFFINYLHPHETGVMGDERGHANNALTYFMLVYLRNHNNIADEIKASVCASSSGHGHGHGHGGQWRRLRNHWMGECSDYYDADTDTWDGKAIFNMARMINIGAAQYHWKSAMERFTGVKFNYHKWLSYDPTRDATMPMEAAIAHRGHTLVAHQTHASDACGTTVAIYQGGGSSGRNAGEWHHTHQFFAARGVDNMVYGLAEQPMPAPDHLTEMMVNLPFFTGRSTITIPVSTLFRSRDSVLGTYTEVFEKYFCTGEKEGQTFADYMQCGDPSGIECFKALARDDENDLPGRLRALYGSVELVDLWIGYLVEPKGPGIFGRLQTRVIATQIRNQIYGDRFWFENARQHSLFVRRRMKRHTLRDIMVMQADDPEIMDSVLDSDVFSVDVDFFNVDDDICANTISYMPPPGFSLP